MPEIMSGKRRNYILPFHVSTAPICPSHSHPYLSSRSTERNSNKEIEAACLRLEAHAGLVSPPGGALPYRLVADPLAVTAKGIEPRGAAAQVDVCIVGEVEANDNDQVGQEQNAALEVVALALAVHVAQQKHAQDHRHHIPLWEEEAEHPVREFRVLADRFDGI